MAEGLKGLVDFVGYPVGEGAAVNVPTAGFHGLCDFVGYPCGEGAQVRKGSLFAAGKRTLAQFLLSEEMARHHRDRLKIAETLELRRKLRREAERVTFQRAVQKHVEMVDMAVKTVFLAEV